jgi:hypothetical protein
MKLIFALLIVVAAALAAQDAPASKPTSEVSGSAAKPPGVPADAIEIEPGIFRSTDATGATQFYRQTPFGVTRWTETSEAPDAAKVPVTDAAGVQWFYRQTPFGLMRLAETPGSRHAPDIDKVFPGLKVVEEGDTLHFERPSPFGLLKWSRKKSQLNEMEKAAWERARSARQN